MDITSVNTEWDFKTLDSRLRKIRIKEGKAVHLTQKEVNEIFAIYDTLMAKEEIHRLQTIYNV